MSLFFIFNNDETMKKKTLLLATLLSTITFNALASSAMIFPQRAFLDSQNRTANFKIVNTKDMKTKYTIEMSQLIQVETGATRPLKEGESIPPAHNNIKYTPRKSIVLDKNDKKPIRLKTVKYGELADGEYRSYLKIITAEANPEAVKGYKVEVRTGIQLPIVIRKGNLTATAGIEDIQVRDNRATFKLTRSGTRSIFGDITITQDSKQIGKSNGAAVYTELNSINMSVPLSDHNPLLPITVSFEEDEMSGNETASNTSTL